MFNHFVDKELTFAVGVAGVDKALGGFDEFPDSGELFLDAGIRLGECQPFFREDRQILHAPDLFALLGLWDGFREVVVGFGLFEKMAEAPGDGVVALADDGGAFFFDDAEFGGDGFGNGGFFSNEEAHGRR